MNADDLYLSPYFGATPTTTPSTLVAPEKLYSPRSHLPKLLVHLQTLRIPLPLQAHFAAVPFGALHLLVVGQHGNITRFTQKGIQRCAFQAWHLFEVKVFSYFARNKEYFKVEKLALKVFIN